MTTQIPTSNGVAGLTSAPSALPDLAALSQLANDFFAALPGQALPDTPAVPQQITTIEAPYSAPPSTAPGVAAHAPALLPSATGHNHVPDTFSQSQPAAGRAGGVALGVPQAYAAALPQAPVTAPQSLAPSGVPTTPYYFLGEASAYNAPQGATGFPINDRVTALSFGLPGDSELKALLAQIDAPAAVPSASSKQASSFYFLDTIESPRLIAQSAHPAFDVNTVRRDFPILQEQVNGRPLAWLDNAATTQKPQSVIDRLAWFYAHENSNIHRAAHELAARATDAYEGARQKVQRFLGAASVEEIIFVRGATEAINLIAKTWGVQNVNAGDEIIISHLEHHANIVPWQQLAAQKGAKLRVIPVDDSGQVLLDEYRKLLNDRTKIVSVTQVSNALGTVVPVKEIVELAHRAGAVAVVDGAQSVSHMRVNVQAIDADFFVFSGHKVFGPTGIGVVYGKRKLLEDMPPWQGGGNMIQDVTFEKTLYHGAPARFEAGTGNIADAVGLGAAIDYVERIGMENIARYEHDLLAYATHGLLTVPGIRLIGTASDKASVLSFVLDGYRTEEVGDALNREGIAVRSGHHCAQPILRRFGVEATVRPSLAFYNTCEEVDRLVATVTRLARAKR